MPPTTRHQLTMQDRLFTHMRGTTDDPVLKRCPSLDKALTEPTKCAAAGCEQLYDPTRAYRDQDTTWARAHVFDHASGKSGWIVTRGTHNSDATMKSRGSWTMRVRPHETHGFHPFDDADQDIVKGHVPDRTLPPWDA